MANAQESPDKTLSTRQCGDCTACCFVAEVKEGIVKKPACQTCPFMQNGCKLYGKPERPQVCQDFQCSWLRGFGSLEDRPDKSGVMVSINHMNGGTWINVFDLKKNAHKTTGKKMIEAIARQVDVPVIVVDADNTKEGKGDYVIIKKSLESRSNKVRGELIEALNDDMNIYKLIIS